MAGINIREDFLVDNFKYFEYLKDDEWGKPVFNDIPVLVDKCRIDTNVNYGANGSSGQSLNYSAVIFCYNGITKNIFDFKVKSKIVFDDNEYIITNVIKCKNPFENTLFSIEIEVV